jgi:hypothetical protein
MSRYVHHFEGDGAVAVFVLSIFGFILTGFAGWVTHILWVIGKITGVAPVTGGEMAIGVIGAFMPPIGAVHGVILWFS